MRLQNLIIPIVCCFLGCSKKESGGNPPPAKDSLTFSVSGFDGSKNMDQTDTITIPISVNYQSGMRQAVALAISGLPPNCFVAFSNQIDTPSYTCDIRLSAFGSPVGAYKVALTATTASRTLTYDLTLNIDTMLPNPALLLVGNYKETGACTPSGTKNNSVQIDVVPGGIYNKVQISGLWVTGGSFSIIADANPAAQSLSIPTQTSGPMSFTGAGTYTADSIYLNYRVSDGAFVQDTCQVILGRLP